MLKIILSIIILSVTGIAAFLVFLNYVLNKIFFLPHINYQKTPKDFDLPFAEKFITTRHQKKVQIWDINPQIQGPVILAVHGWANTSESFLELAKQFENQRLILLHTRNHGGSDDEKYMNLVKYSQDIRAVINYIISEKKDTPKVVLLGHSLGGAAALWAATQDTNVNAVITVGTFADQETVIREGFIQNKLSSNFVSSMLTYIEFRVGEKLITISPVKTIEEYKGPVLLIHGTKDEVVEFTDLNKIRKAARRENVSQFVMKGYGHSDLLAAPELADEIKSFLSKNNLLN